MDIVHFFAIFGYMLSTAAFVAYLFFQRNAWQKAGHLLLLAGFLCHTLLLLWDGVQSGLFPGSNLSQNLILAAWAFSCVFLLVQYRFQLKVLGVYAAPFAAAVMIMAAGLPSETAAGSAFFKSFWVFFHVLTMFGGNGALALACGAGILYLIQEGTIKAKRRGFFFRRLPSLELLDRVGYTCIVSGFTLLTIGLVTGIIYAKTAWGKFWSWDPKEIWSAVVWLFYAALLHERLTVGWRGRKAAIMSIIGFAVILFTFLGVNLVLEGHHKEFTRW